MTQPFLTNQTSSRTGSRLIYLDFIRIIACFFVIVNHTTSDIFLATAPSPVWFISLTYFFISKSAVPLFLMVSGVVLLGRDEPLRTSWKRVLRIAIVLTAFSLLYFTDSIGFSALSFSAIPLFFESIMTTTATNAFWYMYLYIGLLIITPIIRKMVTAMEPKHLLYFLVIALAVPGTLPIITHYIPRAALSSWIFTPFFSAYVGMMVLGFYANTHFHTSKRTVLAAGGLFAALLAMQVGGTYAEYIYNPESYLFYDNRIFITVTASALCIFCIAKAVFSRFSLSPLHGIISTLGKCTFGIYLFADFFMKHLSPLHSMLSASMHPLAAVIIFQFAIFLAGFACTYLLRIIPAFRKYI